MMIKREIFQKCRKLESGVFQSQQQIEKPTLLINAELETHNKFLRFLRLKSVLPITDFVILTAIPAVKRLNLFKSLQILKKSLR